jgi:hypothetical protein
VTAEPLILPGNRWNEAKQIGSDADDVRDALLHVMAFSPQNFVQLVGTAFIVGVMDSCTIAMSAAHVFYEGARCVQAPTYRYHRPALAKFLPEATEISLEENRLGVLYVVRGVYFLCTVDRLVCDRKADIAVFTIACQDREALHASARKFELLHSAPTLGEKVVLAGFRKMQILRDETNPNGERVLEIDRKWCMRVGSVTALHPTGHSPCRGPCIETNIPVFSGMSGGPAFLCSEEGQVKGILGIISTDLEASDATKASFQQAGSSIVSLVPSRVTGDLTGEPTISVDFLNEFKIIARTV